MPIVITASEAHPFLPSLGDPTAIAEEKALHQDIRPLEIAILNLMADKQTTELQLARWLGHTPLQVRLTFVTTDSYVASVKAGHKSKSTPSEHISKYYNAWSDVKDRKFDGLLVTGVNLLDADVTSEGIWDEIQEIFNWSKTNVLSSMYICWAGFAAMRYFHDIKCHNGKTKTLGVFEHGIEADSADLLFGLPDRFPIPVGRWQRLHRDKVEGYKALELVSCTDEGDIFLVAENKAFKKGCKTYPRRIFMFNHPEYDTDTMKKEYLRDIKSFPDLPIPPNYFPDDDIEKTPINTWRYTAAIYGNWIKSLYEATPYDINDIPEACE
ncbi:homoserine O-acetyltransferase/O-succinyltransferase family protein [Kiloniella litopenaei]|uniref:homoserine O-acetyltransferase/O-succinyltransferase family protein n=2 Tax=Kiloniella litopenaei TaxID=1549748 RepID=UPI003BAA9DA0